VTLGDGTGDNFIGNVVSISSTDVGDDLTVTTGTGASGFRGNQISIALITVGHDLTFSTGTGFGGGVNGAGNLVFINSTAVGHDLTITTGTGTGGDFGNVVSIFSTTVSTTVGNDLAVTTLDGAGSVVGNGVFIDSTAVGSDLAITTGNRNAEVFLASLVVEARTTVRTGSGDDSVEVQDSTFHGLATFDGGDGTDTFQDLGGNDFAAPPILIDFEVV
jgi:hypothetical protein